MPKVDIFESKAEMNHGFIRDVVKTDQAPNETLGKAALPGSQHSPEMDVRNLAPRMRGCHY